jgi:hypothetical protein
MAFSSFRRQAMLATLALPVLLAGCESALPTPTHAEGAYEARVSTSPVLSGGTASLAVAAPVDPTDLIVNGSFETNSGGTTFAGWTELNAGNGDWIVQSGPSNVGFAPPDGNFAAMSTQGGPGQHILYQDVIIPAQGATLSFLVASRSSAAFLTPESISHTAINNQQFRVDAIETTSPVATLNSSDVLLFRTTGTPTIFAHKLVTVDLSGATFGGRTIRLRFTEVDNRGNFYLSLDRVQLIPNAPLDVTPPSISANVAGTLGTNGWYTSDVSIAWSVADAETPVTSPACAPGSVTSDTPGATFSCSATSTGGTATSTVTVKRDATAPVVAYAGNAGSYTVDQTVAITCSATDAMSGIASASCANVAGAAYSFAIGANSFSATATDQAGNVGGAVASFTVTVTPAGICALVNQFVANKGNANAMCKQLEQNGTRAFINHVEAQSGKALSAPNAATLIALAQAL